MQPLVLVDADWRGQPRKLLLQANRNGFFYVLDRIDGKMLMATPLVKKLTWAKEIAPDGRPVMNPNQVPTPRRHADLPRSGRRRQLLLDILQSGDPAVLCEYARAVRRVHQARHARVAGRTRISGWRRAARSRTTSRRRSCAPSTSTPASSCGNFLRTDREIPGPARCPPRAAWYFSAMMPARWRGGRLDRQAAMELSVHRESPHFADDLHVRRQAICRDHQRQRRVRFRVGVNRGPKV